MRRLLPVLLCLVFVAAGCADSDSAADNDLETTTTAVTAVAEARATTTTQPTTTSAAPVFAQLAADQHEGVDASEVLLVEALIAAYNAGDGVAFVDAMGAAEQILYYDYFGEGGYTTQIDPSTQADSIEEWDHPLGFRWELRRCEPSEDLPGTTECLMYRYDPIANTEMHRFPVDAVLSVATEDGAVQDVWLKYLEPNWNVLVWKLSRWVTIFHPEDWDEMFNTEVASSDFNYWDLHHTAASAAMLAEHVNEWERMTTLSQDKEFYDWVSEHEPEALDMMWPTGRIQDHTFFVEQATYWTRLVDEYPG